ncbi:hypothetical protein [Nocardia ninae]|uniref:hypothetical protein n=1 Tax=Nocardia ninae TaxID=356145 RepID=UPI0039EF4F6B
MLEDFLGLAPSIFPLQVLQTPDTLTHTARELVQDWHADGVVYGEVRFAPQLHGRNGMSIDDAVHAVAAGVAQGSSDTGVRYRRRANAVGRYARAPGSCQRSADNGSGTKLLVPWRFGVGRVVVDHDPGVLILI